MTAAFGVMSLLNWWHEGHSWRWTGGIAVLFLAVALFRPAALRPLNQLWLKFGLFEGQISREFSTVRAFGAARGCGGSSSSPIAPTC
jgi:hypothetical protein